MTTQYGIIGCGMMGREHLQNIALLDDTSVAVIYEPDAAMAEAALALCPDARLASSLDDLLLSPELDCLVIVSPNHCHMEQLDAIAKRVTCQFWSKSHFSLTHKTWQTSKPFKPAITPLFGWQWNIAICHLCNNSVTGLRMLLVI